MNPSSTQPQLLALLVGIDSYKKPITPLNGCVNDVRKMEAFLKEQKKHFNVHLKTLTNEEAIKANIVEEFKTHLGMAKEGDTTLFYYSGHGTQEEANAAFWPGEPDKKLESLVCFDAVEIVDGKPTINLLADKELRFLIGELSESNPHIITILDCCHSGTNTRNGLFSKEGETILERKVIHRERLSRAFPERPWSDFIFGKTITETDVLEKDITFLFKEGQHVQMAACQNDESAYEVAGEGVFTKNLIDILQRCNGNISYHRLQSTIQSYLRHQFKQTPKIYVAGDDSQLFSGFLNKEMVESELYGTVSYHSDLGWLLDMGSLQGIAAKTEISLTVENLDKEYQAEVSNVFVSYSQVSVFTEEEETLSTNHIFKAKMNSVMGRSLQLFISPVIVKNFQTTGLIQKIKVSDTIHQVENLQEADYCLIDETDNVLLTTPERSTIPLVPKIPLNSLEREGDTRLLNYLEHISKFEFIKYLTNPGAFLLRPDHVDIKVFIKDEPVAIKNDELSLNYIKTGSEWGGGIRMKVKNTSSKKLYAALCYLSFNFGVFTRIFPSGVVGLEPGAEAWALDGSTINFKLEPEVLAIPYNESTSYIKLLISTEDFTQQLFTLDLDNLPGPLQEEMNTRGLTLNKGPQVVHDWTSRLITLHMPNPEL